MHSFTRLTVFLCGLWVVTLLYGEMVAYWAAFWTCSWPQPRLSSSFSKTDHYVKVAVLADPQLMDRTSHGLPPKSLLLEAAQFYTDLYMRRSFHSSILPFKPDLIVFLGDQFDGGPFLSDEEWQESLNRFKHIFSLNEKGRDLAIPIYYLPGNHDIGYAGFHSRYPKVATLLTLVWFYLSMDGLPFPVLYLVYSNFKELNKW
ncbi:Calcineurin-like phosphoesterase [Musa troglodytarum]|uniref:Calcineurin-like phosphoesterase n=1 Tax=Musa troglodytarum TaxID=320322 RepID=A0A9E7HS96_9LILI|nr:Calcineurin-like phosphoesterase [Musa troglodytarum]